MKKILIVAHYSRFLIQFELGNVKILQSLGYEVHYATNYVQEDMYRDSKKIINESGVILHQIDFVRSPYKVYSNIKAYNQLVKLMNNERFDSVHCHTPMGGALARLAAKRTNTKPVLYTAHGFHFYKGCPKINRIIYENVERFLSKYTDGLITINKEDFEVAKTFPLRGNTFYVPGVGIDLNRIENVIVDRETKRIEIGIPKNAKVYVTVGELIPRKNHSMLIDAFAKANISNSILLICGSGKEEDKLSKLILRNGLQSKIKLLGFRSDVFEILKASDVFVFPSKQEGLPVALMEAMAAGLPCVASKIRGNVDLLLNSVLLFQSDDVTDLTRCLKLSDNFQICQSEIMKNNFNIQEFRSENVKEIMTKIYNSILNI